MIYGWTLDKQLWKRLFEAVGARKWKKIPFSKLERAEVPERQGVYVFCARPYANGCSGLLTSLCNAVYVGQATNLRRRFDDHCGKPMPPMYRVRECFSQSLEFWFTTLDTAEELCNIESILIECLGPAANRQKGPVFVGKLCEGQPA